MATTQRQPRKRNPGRRCKTKGCPGIVKQIKRTNFATHIERRFSCRLCGLRWKTIEKDLPNSIAVDGEHGTKMASQRLADLSNYS